MKSLRSTLASVADYGDLIGLIPSNPKFSPSDIDGICERKGNFLVMEWKRPGEKFSKGQEILLRALAKTPHFIVVIMYGDTDDGLNFSHCWLYDNKGNASKKYTTFEEFKEFFRLWYELQ